MRWDKCDTTERAFADWSTDGREQSVNKVLLLTLKIHMPGRYILQFYIPQPFPLLHCLCFYWSVIDQSTNHMHVQGINQICRDSEWRLVT